MHRNTIIGLLAIFAIILGVVFLVGSQASQPAPTTEKEHKVVRATYSNGSAVVEASFDIDAQTVTFTEAALGTVTLPQAISASGARYATSDERIVFWEHQGVVTITKDGKEVFRSSSEPLPQEEESQSDATAPYIDMVTPSQGALGTVIEVRGRNFSGFEGDLTVWIENAAGTRGIVFGDRAHSTSGYIRFALAEKYCTEDTSYSGLPCPAYVTITPGTYTLYTEPWGKKSNEVQFRVTE